MNDIEIRVTTRPTIQLEVTSGRGPQGEQGPPGAPGTTDYNELDNLPDLSVYALQTEVDAINDALDGPASATHVYLSGLNGNDANDGLTPGTAVATYARVWELLPSIVHRPFVVHVGAHSGAGYIYALPPENRVFAEGAFVVVYGDGAGQSGEDGFTVVASGVAGAGTTSTVLELAVAPATDAYAGFTVEYTSGPANGQRRLIRDTVAALATLVTGTETLAATVTPLPGNSYRVVRPSAALVLPVVRTGSTTVSYTCLSESLPIHAVNLRLESAATALTLSDDYTFFFGVELSPTLHLAPDKGSLNAGFDGQANGNPSYSVPGFEFIRTLISNYAQGTWNGWGLTQPTVTGTAFSFRWCRSIGCFVGHIVCFGFVALKGQVVFCGGRSNLIAGTDGTTEIGNVSCFFSAAAVPFLVRVTGVQCMQLTGNSVVVLQTKASTVLALSLETTDASANATVLFLQGGSRLLGANGLAMSAPNSVGGALIVCTGSEINLRSLSGRPSTFNIPSGYGIICDKGSRVVIDGWTSFNAETALVVGSKAQLILTQHFPSQGLFPISAVTRIASIEGGTLLYQGGASSWSGSVANGGAVQVIDGGVFEQATDLAGTRTPTPGILTITNTALGATAHGLKVSGGSRAYLRGGANTVINANGYGVDARFGGQVYFGAQPSSVVGATADLIVDTTVGGQPDTALAASESAIAFQTGGLGAFNGSLIARAS